MQRTTFTSSASKFCLQCVSQKVAQAIDAELMSASGGFSVDQLMELGKIRHSLRIYTHNNRKLAGLSVAQAIQRVYDNNKKPHVLVCVGPGKAG